MLNCCRAIAADFLKSFAAPCIPSWENIATQHIATSTTHASHRFFVAENPRALGHLSQQIFQQILWPCILTGSNTTAFALHSPIFPCYCTLPYITHHTWYSLRTFTSQSHNCKPRRQKLVRPCTSTSYFASFNALCFQSQHVPACLSILQLWKDKSRSSSNGILHQEVSPVSLEQKQFRAQQIPTACEKLPALITWRGFDWIQHISTIYCQHFSTWSTCKCVYLCRCLSDEHHTFCNVPTIHRETVHI